MRIISWNCNGAFRRKFHLLEQYKADLYIIQECENPELTSDLAYRAWASNYLWVGTSKNKGLGVFTSDKNILSRLDLSLNHWADGLKWFIPFKFNNDYDLVAVWTQATPAGEYRYIGQFYLLLENNLSALENVLFIGDFNSNKIWDYKRKGKDHSACVSLMKAINTHSLYHAQTQEPQGLETIPTFYLQKNPNKKYHIDYAFVPQSLVARSKLELGLMDDWMALSDHMPLFIDLA